MKIPLLWEQPSAWLRFKCKSTLWCHPCIRSRLRPWKTGVKVCRNSNFRFTPWISKMQNSWYWNWNNCLFRACSWVFNESLSHSAWNLSCHTVHSYFMSCHSLGLQRYMFLAYDTYLDTSAMMRNMIRFIRGRHFDEWTAYFLLWACQTVSADNLLELLMRSCRHLEKMRDKWYEAIQISIFVSQQKISHFTGAPVYRCSPITHYILCHAMIPGHTGHAISCCSMSFHRILFSSPNGMHFSGGH